MSEEGSGVALPAAVRPVYVEQVLFGLDLFTAGLFLVAEVFKFMKRLWSELRDN